MVKWRTNFQYQIQMLSDSTSTKIFVQTGKSSLNSKHL